MIIAHWGSSNISSTWWYCDTCNWFLKFILKDCFCLSSICIPNNNSWFSSHLSSCYQMFFWVDIKTSNIIVVLGINFLHFFKFIKNDSTSCCMIDNLIVPIVFEVWSGIITSVSINVVNIKFLIWWIASFDWLLVTHVFDGGFPTRCWVSLISCRILDDKIIILDLMI